MFFIGCQPSTQTNFIFLNNYNQKEIKNNTIQKADSIPALDTTIFIKKQIFKKEKGKVLTDETAKNVLYQYYRKRKFCVDGAVPKGKSKLDDNSMCVTFDTAYLVNLSCDNNLDAIVQYWITPYGGSGHCYQPHKAIILNSNRGLVLQNEDFIGEFHSIDSIIQINNCSVTLYGNEWDCGGTNETIKKFKVTLK